MSLNWKEIDLVLSELSLCDGKIQKILQPEFYSLYLGIYAQQQLHHLCISLEQNAVRIHLEPHALKKPLKAQRFQQLLQSRLIGTRIQKIKHLGHDRIILISCQHTTLEEESYSLYVRLWNNQANVVLCNKEDQIIDALYRRPKQKIMPKELFQLPPQNPKKTERITEIREWELSDAGGAGGSAGGGAGGGADGGGTDGASTSSAPFNTYIALFYSQKKRKRALQDTIAKYWNHVQRNIPYLEKSVTATKKQIEVHAGFEQSKKIGTTLLNNITKIQEGQEWFEIEEDGSKLQVHLDPQVSTAQNAENYFKQYKKSQRVLESLGKKLTDLTHDYEQAVKMKELLEKLIAEQTDNQDSVADFPELQKKLNELAKLAGAGSDKNRLNVPAGLRTGLQAGPHARNAQKAATKGSTGLKIVDRKYTYFVGRNAKENDMLLRKTARGNDTWMHVRGKSGAYVFIRPHNKQSIPLDNLETAAQLAALFSKCKHNSSVDFHYTQVKHLRKIPEKLGLVSVQHDKNLLVVFNSDTAKKLVNQEK